jgi:DNA processing protein
VIHAPSALLIQTHRRLGDTRIARWLARYSVGQAAEALQDLEAANTQSVPESTEKLAGALHDRGAGVITLLDMEYPACFRALDKDAPPLLYLIGDVTRLMARSIAIIGTRRPTSDGRSAATQVAHGAVAAGWIIVSGNAPGIDCAGHTGAVQSTGGQTLVFPPASLDQYRPVFRGASPEQVTVATPFPPGTDILPWMFLRRNTLVAAQCRAAFVAETGVRGGTLDTIKKLAAWQRPVFATLLPPEARYAAAHSMLATGNVQLLDVLQHPAAATEAIISAARKTRAHPPVNTAVLGDFFAGEEWG